MRTSNLFLKILSVFLFLTTFSCEEKHGDDFIDNSSEKISISEEKRNSTNIRTVNINEIPLINSHLTTIIGRDAFSTAKKNGDPIIDGKNIIEITDSLNRRNYSFSMIVNEKKYKGPRLYNLIVGLDSIGRISDPMVLRFKPKEKYEQEWLDNDLDLSHFTGKVSLHKYTAFFNENPLSAIGDLCPPEHDEYGDPIICVEDDVSSSGSGGGSSGGSFAPAGGDGGGAGGDSEGGGDSRSCTFSFYWNACGGTNENIAHGSGVCGGDGSGAGWVLEIDCPDYSTSVYFLEGKSSDCPDCATGPSGDLAINTFHKSVLKLQNVLSSINYSLSNSQLTWLNINYDVSYKIMQFLLNKGLTTNNKELAAWAIEQFMSQEIPCGNIGADCIKSIKEMALGLRKFHGSEGKLMADYLESLIADYSSFNKNDLTIFHDTAKKITIEFNNYMFASIVYGFAKGVQPIVEIALFEVGASVAIKLLSKLPALVRTSQITEVLNNLKLSSSLSKFKYAEKFGLKTYAQHVKWFENMGILRSKFEGIGVEIHHLVEKRFAGNVNVAKWIGSKTDDFKSIVLTAKEHDQFTQAWKLAIGYDTKAAGWTGYRTSTVPLDVVKKVAKIIYKDYPEILTALGL